MKLSAFLTWFDDYIAWGVGMIVFLIGTHIYMTYKTGFIQKYLFKGIKLSVTKDNSKNGDLSVFGALMTALSSTIGTGNIIGVGTAILKGGPGAIFWTWIGGFFGIATKYAETWVAVKYRKLHSNGQYSGGAMVAFEKLGKPFLAKLFAVLCALAAFGIGCATQSSAIANSIQENFGVSSYVSGAVLCALIAIVIFGGVKSIAKVCERLVPVMSILYVVGCAVILIVNGKYLPQAFMVIIQSAFTGKAVVGGFMGLAVKKVVQNGISRGLFSNESGMGSAPQASAAGVASNAVKPALIGSTGVFWDTIVVCLMTGLVIVSSVIANDAIDLASGAIISSASLVSKTFGQIPYIGTPLLVFGILTFAFSTILGWSYYGENAIRYLFGHYGIIPYRIAWVLVAFLGVMFSESSVWVVADILNAAMCVPNCILIIMLGKQMVEDTNYYLKKDNLDEVDDSLE